jgi:hypothetical protein
VRDVQRYLWPRLCTIDKEKQGDVISVKTHFTMAIPIKLKILLLEQLYTTVWHDNVQKIICTNYILDTKKNNPNCSVQNDIKIILLLRGMTPCLYHCPMPGYPARHTSNPPTPHPHHRL